MANELKTIDDSGGSIEVVPIGSCAQKHAGVNDFRRMNPPADMLKCRTLRGGSSPLRLPIRLPFFSRRPLLRLHTADTFTAMVSHASMAELHRKRRERFLAQAEAAARRARHLSTARLVVFLAAAGMLLIAWDARGRPRLALGVAAGALAIAFGALVRAHVLTQRERVWQVELARGSEWALARLRRDWSALPPPNPHEAPKDHPYAADLDVFGRASLAQLLCAVSTAPGRVRLRHWLLRASPADQVRERQDAVAELAPLLDLRDELAARGRLSGRVDPARIQAFVSWAEGPRWLAHEPALRAAGWLVPAVTLTLAGLQIAGVLREGWWGLGLLAAAVVTWLTSRRAHPIFDRAASGEQGVAGYAEQLALLERCDFRAPCLKRLVAELQAEGGSARALRRLDGLLSYAEARNNTLFWLPVQLLFLWDLHVLRALERWQATSGPHVRGWFEALGQADALAALAGLAHDNPSWTRPTLATDGAAVLNARALAHPLLPPDVAVGNDVTVGPPGTYLLVTGSNASGKSTLLRAIGLNAVLAQAGAPVCAASLTLPAVELWTSMRVTDSLERGLSHFMAELTRLKQIVDAARRLEGDGGRTLLYLVDEVLQGTNSAERQIAARRIIRHLVDHGAIGAVTTHDLEVADAPELTTATVPVHFRETVHTEADAPPLTFDYRLREGVATSRNALKLMEIVGLGDGG